MIKITKKRIIAFIVSVVLVLVLITQINLNDIRLIINNLNPIYFVFSFLIFLLSQFLKSVRFRILINRPINFLSLFKITSLGIIANQILPARTGELSYPYLFKKVFGFQLGQGAVVLIIARILDLFSIIILWLLSVFLVINNQEIAIKLLFSGLIILLLVLTVLLLLFFAGLKILKLIKKIIILLKIQNYKFSNYLYNGLQVIINNLLTIKSSGMFFLSVLFSFLIWISMYCLTYTIVRSLGLGLSFFEGVFVSTFPLITSVLPIHGLVGFGTTEGAWTIGMLLLGEPKGLAISSGFGLHFIVLFFSSITALYSFLTIKFKE